MGTFFASYPSLTASANPSVGPNGQPIPGDSTLVAGENPSGNQQPLQTDSSGSLLVTISTEPTTPLNVNLTEVGGAAVTLGQKTSAVSIPVVIASDDTVAISATALPLPTGAATAMNQASEITELTTIVANQTNGTQTTQISGTVPLPTGAATSANQTNATQKTQIVDGSGNVIASTSNALDVAIQGTVPISGPVSVTQGTSPWVDNISQFGGSNVVTGTGASGAGIPRVTVSNDSNVIVSQGTAASLNATVVQATGTNLHVVTDTGSTTTVTQGTAANLNATVVQTTASNLNAAVVGTGTAGTPNAGVVTIQGISGGTAIPISGTVTSTPGSAIANPPVQNIYSSTNITTGAYVQLVASTTHTTNTIHIFDSSGQAMILGVGASGSEVIQLYVPPGGDTYTLDIPSGSRIAYKALSANAVSGYLLMSFLQ
jgi:hypothetical protein